MKEQVKISINNLNFYYHKNQAIKALNLEVKTNEILAIFGPANSGTTTLLRTINRMNDFTPGMRINGEIFLDGKNIYSPGFSLTSPVIASKAVFIEAKVGTTIDKFSCTVVAAN